MIYFDINSFEIRQNELRSTYREHQDTERILDEKEIIQRNIKNR